MNNNGVNPASSLMVKRAIMFETGRYDDAFLRPYVTRFDQNVNNEFADATEDGTRISSGALSYVSSSFLQPASVANTTANLANGFGERRFSFMMEITSVGNHGNPPQLMGGVRRIATGYTDHLGVSALSGEKHLDPNMKIYFNNIFVLRDSVIPTPNGSVTETNVVKNKHIIYNKSDNDYLTATGAQFTLRPEDVMMNLDNSVNPNLAGFRSENIHDGRAMLTGIKMSDRSFESRPNYLSKTMQSYGSAQVKADTYEDDEADSSLFSNARDYLREEPLTADTFMQSLMANYNYRESAFITYGELCLIVGGLDQRLEVMSSSAPQRAAQYDVGQGESWRGSTYETIAATIISHAVPAIMADCLLTRCGFQATNDVIGGADDVVVFDAHGFADGLDYSKYIVHFIERLKREVLYDISRRNECRYQIRVTIDMINDSSIEIAFEGEPLTRYVVASFCDGLTAPIVADSIDYVDNISTDIGAMLSSVTNMEYGNTSSPQPFDSHGGGPSGFDTSNNSL